jgi:2-dehydro-3-deoxyphosphogalactonate aldolase
MAPYVAAGADGFGLGSALYQRGRTPAETAARAAAFAAAYRDLRARDATDLARPVG